MFKRVTMALAMAMVTVPALAQAQSPSDIAGDVLTQVERQIIRDYFKNKAGRTGDENAREQDRRDAMRRGDDGEDSGYGAEEGDDAREHGKSDKGRGKEKGGKYREHNGNTHKEKGRGEGKRHGGDYGMEREDSHAKRFPPGLAKRGALPPGLARQLEKNGTLPPGLARRDLPEDLSRRLPAAGPGKERVVVGNDVVLIEKATGVVLDILKDVVAGKAGR